MVRITTLVVLVTTLVHVAWVFQIQSPPAMLLYACYAALASIGLWSVRALSRAKRILVAVLVSPLISLGALSVAYLLDGQIDRLTSIKLGTEAVLLFPLMFGAWLHFPVLTLALVPKDESAAVLN